MFTRRKGARWPSAVFGYTGAISRSNVSHQTQPACSNMISSAATTFAVEKVVITAAQMMLREKNSGIRDMQTNFILSYKRTTQRTTPPNIPRTRWQASAEAKVQQIVE